MSEMREVLPVLLWAERNGEDLNLLVDIDPESRNPDDASILNLRFSGCASTPEARAQLDYAEVGLREGIGLPFEWRISEGGEAEFYSNYNYDYINLTFSALSESSTPPTLDHVHRRVARLAEAIDDLTRRYWSLDHQYRDLVLALEREAERETMRAAQKLPFLRERGSPSAKVVEGRVAAFERVRAIVHQSRADHE